MAIYVTRQFSKQISEKKVTKEKWIIPNKDSERNSYRHFNAYNVGRAFLRIYENVENEAEQLRIA